MCGALRWCGFALAARVLLAPSPVVGQTPGGVLDVPYVTQSEALCGGAAAAMVLRYWGERGVDAEAFEPLLNASRDGIETGVLAEALVQRGWRVLALTGTLQAMAHHIGLGRPLVALIAVGPGRYHYVVVVHVTATQVVYHDPAGRPRETATRADFDAAWSAASRWTLLVLPGEAPPATAVDTSAALPPLPAACRADLSRAGESAGARRWMEAERFLEAARVLCPFDGAPLRELAGLRLLQGRAADAVPLARAAVGRDPGDLHAWKILGTAEFLERNQLGALDAWNRTGEPINDLLRLDGLTRTRQRVVSDRLGLTPGTVLDSASLGRARRRLAEVPAVGPSRLDVVPVGGGRVEVRGAVVERPLMPVSPAALAGLGVRALVHREVTWRVTSPTGAGERLDLSARWWEARPAAAIGLSVPVDLAIVAGILRVEGGIARESFASPAGARDVEDRRSAVVSLSDWATANLRWQATARVDRWRDRETAIGIGGAIERHAGSVAAVRAQGDVWPATGDRIASLGARWRLLRQGDTRLLASMSAIAASQDTPRSLWGGAGTGHGRPLLLRAHPLLEDGVIAGDAFGQRLLHATVEGRRRLAVPGPFRLHLAAFLDAAAASRVDRAAVAHVDAGFGIRIGIPGEGTMRVDYAHALDDRRQALSVGWELPWPAWP